jgi:hypothetical protein
MGSRSAENLGGAQVGQIDGNTFNNANNDMIRIEQRYENCTVRAGYVNTLKATNESEERQRRSGLYTEVGYNVF